jgi:circadian clock protein KaiB
VVRTPAGLEGAGAIRAPLMAKDAPRGLALAAQACMLDAERTRVGPPAARLSPRVVRTPTRRARATERNTAVADYLLKLYVTGRTPRSEKAIANLRRICDEELHGQYEMQIIDVLEHPQLAEDEKILATPTLIKRLPPPLRRVIGDLSDTEKVLLGLDVWPETPTASGDDDA